MNQDKEWEVEASIKIKTSFQCKTKEEAEKMAHAYLIQLCKDLHPNCYSNSYEIDDIYSYTESGIDKNAHINGALRTLLNGVATMPSVTPQDQRWISVSESLPEPNANDGLIVRHYLIQNEYEDMLVARYDGIGWEQMYQHEYLKDDVIAWMPLPAPYEPQERDE